MLQCDGAFVFFWASMPKSRDVLERNNGRNYSQHQHIRSCLNAYFAATCCRKLPILFPGESIHLRRQLISECKCYAALTVQVPRPIMCCFLEGGRGTNSSEVCHAVLPETPARARGMCLCYENRLTCRGESLVCVWKQSNELSRDKERSAKRFDSDVFGLTIQTVHLKNTLCSFVTIIFSLWHSKMNIRCLLN